MRPLNNNTHLQAAPARIDITTGIKRTCALLFVILLTACGELSEEELIARANQALSEHHTNAAVIDLKSALRLNSNNSEARWLLGQTYVAMGDGASAEKELRRAQDLGVANESLLLPLTKAYQLQNKHQDIIELKTPAKSLGDDLLATLLSFKGAAYLALSEYSSAENLLNQALEIMPEHSAATVNLAALKMALGDMAQARQLLEQVNTASPDYLPGWRQLAILEQLEGNYPTAISVYSTILETDGQNKLALIDRVRRALLYLETKEIEKARQDVKKAREAKIHFPMLDFASGLIALEEGKLSDAKAFFQKALNTDPDYAPAELYLGLTQFKTGELEQARTTLTSYQARVPSSTAANKLLGGIYLLQGDRDLAKTTLNRALASNPQDTNLTRLLGQISLAEGDTARATELFSLIVEKEADNATNYLQLGQSYSAAGQKEAALNAYLRATELDPELQGAALAIVSSYINDGEFDKALEYCSNLKKKWPKRTDPFILASAVHLAEQDRVAAKLSLKEALDLVPGDPAASHNLASFAMQENDFETARQLYKHAMNEHPEDTDTLMRLAKLELVTGDKQGALKLVNQALKLEPTSVDIRATLASYYVSQGDPGEAMAIIERHADHYSQEPAYLETRAKIQIALGNFSEAKISALKLTDLQPQYAEGYYLLAKAETGLGNTDSLAPNLMKALSFDPNHFESRLTLVRVLLNNGAVEQSDITLENLQTHYATHPQVLYLTGLQMLRDKSPAQALKLFKQAQALEPQSEYVTATAVALFHLNEQKEGLETYKIWLKTHPKDLVVQYEFANTLLLLNRQLRAEQEFRNVLLINPAHAPALNNLAWLIHEKNPSEAEELANKALGVLPKFPQALHTLAVIKLNQDKPEEAITLLESGLDISPDDFRIQYRLAKAFEKNNQRERATLIYKELLDNDDVPQEMKVDIRNILAQL